MARPISSNNNNNRRTAARFSFIMLLSMALVLMLCLLSSGDELQVPWKPGLDVCLPCQADTDPVGLLEWTRPDLGPHTYVYFYRNQRLYEKFQDLHYQGRVKLKDPEMKDGDVSVVLRNVSLRDAGTYKCVVTTSSTEGSEPHSETKSLIHLKFTDAGHTIRNEDGFVRLRFGIIVAVIVVVVFVALVALVIVRKRVGLSEILHTELPLKMQRMRSPEKSQTS